MSRPVIALLVTHDDDGAFALRAPRVGVWSSHPPAGSLVGPGSSAGTLTQLRHAAVLLVPDGVAGRVAIAAPRDHAVPVAYGEVLFRVTPLTSAAAVESAASAAGAVDPSAALHVTAPTAGVFYRSPSPGAKAYVASGDRVVAGQAIGLIEVMKTFNPIAYGGAGLPESATVIELLARDGEEVRAGQPLIAVR